MSIDTSKPGINPPDEINVVVEIPKGSSIKYEIDPKSGEIYMDRMLFPAMFYPFNYGFIPQTREEGGDDGGPDPIDVFILGNYSLLLEGDFYMSFNNIVNFILLKYVSNL